MGDYVKQTQCITTSHFSLLCRSVLSKIFQERLMCCVLYYSVSSPSETFLIISKSMQVYDLSANSCHSWTPFYLPWLMSLKKLNLDIFGCSAMPIELPCNVQMAWQIGSPWSLPLHLVLHIGSRICCPLYKWKTPSVQTQYTKQIAANMGTFLGTVSYHPTSIETWLVC